MMITILNKSWLISQSPESSHPSDISRIQPPILPTVQCKNNSAAIFDDRICPPTTYFNDQDIPWVILKSPEQTDDQYSSFEIYPHDNQPDNVKQVPEMTLLTTNPWLLALKSAYLRKNSTFSTFHHYSIIIISQHLLTINLTIQMTPRMKTAIPLTGKYLTLKSLLNYLRTTAKDIPTTGTPMTTDLPTTDPPTTLKATSKSSNLISYSTQPQTIILNHDKFNSFPTFPASNETPVATNIFTSPAPTEPSHTVKVGLLPDNDANIFNITLKEEKFILTELQRTLKRNYDKLMKIMS
jgi:hypothetical protein